MDGGQEIKTKFVVGLGNPGSKYEGTRHNLGFRVLEALRQRWSADGPRKAFAGQVWDARPTTNDENGPDETPPPACRQGARVMLLGPQTYMNNSGRAVAEMTRFYKADAEDVLIVLDDMALPPGQVRARAGGSAGGHKGLADVLRALGTQQVPRLRIGIGASPGPMDPVDFVLTRFTEDEQPLIEASIAAAAQAVEDWVFHGIRRVMDTYNRRAGPQEP